MRYRYKKLDEESGMVSAETAFGMLAVGFVLSMLLILIGGVVSYFHAQDLSIAGARSAALGNSDTQVVQEVQNVDKNAKTEIRTHGNYVDVTVYPAASKIYKYFGITLSATTTSYREP